MDVTHLIPESRPNRSDATDARARSLGVAAGAPAGAPASSHASVTPRPAAPTAHVGDRIERSPESQERIDELKRELGQPPELDAQQIEQLRQEIRESRAASHETLLRAALGILHGELYFLPA